MTSGELARLAARKQMIPHAPVLATRSARVAAPVSKVWGVLTNVSDWERWHPYLANASLAGRFVAETQLTYGSFIKHKLHIATVDHEELVMLYGTLAGYQGITRWDLQRTREDETVVSFTESSAGFLIGTLYSSEKLGAHLERWLDALKVEVERKPWERASHLSIAS